jgi:glycosyltransferase involved in cell wall biosynthesis
LAQALLTLLRDPDLIRQYGQAARESVEEHYALEKITNTYVEVYNSLTGYKQQTQEEYISI